MGLDNYEDPPLDPDFEPVIEPFGMSYREEVPILESPVTKGGTGTTITATVDWPPDKDPPDTDDDI